MSGTVDKPFVKTNLSEGFVRKNRQFINPVMPVDFSKEKVSYNRGGSRGRTRNFVSQYGGYYGGDNSGSNNLSSTDSMVMNRAHVSDVNVGLKKYGKSYRTLQKSYVKSEKKIAKGEKKIASFTKRFSPKVAKHVGAYISAVFNPGSVSARKLEKLRKKSEKVSKKFSTKVEKISTRFGGKATDIRQKGYFKAASKSNITDHTRSPEFTEKISSGYKSFDLAASKRQSQNKDFKNLNLSSDISGNLYGARNISYGRTRDVVTNAGFKTWSSFKNRRNSVWGRTKPEKVNVTFPKP